MAAQLKSSQMSAQLCLNEAGDANDRTQVSVLGEQASKEPMNVGNSTRSAIKKTVTTTTTTTTKTSSLVDSSEPLESVAIVEDLGRQAASVDTSNGLIGRREQARREQIVQNQLSSSNNNNNSSVNEQQVDNTSNDINLDVNNLNVDGNKAVTTISTIAAQSSQSRIVVALLKDGIKFQLKIQEMRPGVFEVGTNHRECQKYYEEHEKVIKNLNKQRQAPLECWLGKYQKITSMEPNMSAEMKLVYMCMAENLQGCWRALLGQLETRLYLLGETCKFYESADRLQQALDRADNHVQTFRQEFLDASPGSIRFNQACNELKLLNQTVLDEYLLARRKQQQVVQLIGKIATSNLGDSRVNNLISDAQNLINYINSYLDPLERRKIQLENVLKTTRTTTTIEKQTKQFLQPEQLINEQINNNTTTMIKQYNSTSNGTNNDRNKRSVNFIREISNFNDLNLVDNWLNVKIDQLNSSLLSSLGVSVQDTRSILSKHEQIALECSAIEEATLTFNGKNIHAIKSVEPKDDNYQGDKSLFEQQKSLASRSRDVITILDARIVLLRRTIDFYTRAKDATTDISKMMRRLQVDNSLQSVQFVANELELKDVSSVVASGATIISELQQLQLAQKHGQRSRIVNLNLLTNGIRAVIDQLNQDLAHLKTVLNQRKLVLLNEDATKMANNFSNKCHQLQFWLNNHAKSFLLANNRLGIDINQVRIFCDGHEQLRVSIQNKTLEVEALLRLLSTLTESFEAKSHIANEIQCDTDELRQDWINTTNCLDRRIELAKKYLAILNTVEILDKELDSLDKRVTNKPDEYTSGRPKTPDERTDKDIKSNIDQSLVQLTNQVRNFNIDAHKSDTSLVYSPALDARPVVNDINKEQLVDHTNGLLRTLTDRKDSVFGDLGGSSRWQPRGRSTRTTSTTTTTASRTSKTEPAPIIDNDNSAWQQSGLAPKAPTFTRPLVDKEVEPFSTIELECETDPSVGNCKIEWLMNNLKKIPASIKHSTWSDGSRHKLIISQFNPMCCGTYIARAVSQSADGGGGGGGQSATTSCRLRLSGIKEVHADLEGQQHQQQQQQLHQDPVGGPNPNGSLQVAPARLSAAAPSSASPAASTTSSFSQWRPVGKSQTSSSSSTTTTISKERALERIIRGVDESTTGAQSGDRPSAGASQHRPATKTSSDISGSPSAPFPVTQTTYNGPVAGATNANQLRISHIDSPTLSSSTNLSRSISKSPFEGTPQAPLFMQNLTDSMPNCCSRAGLVCVVVGNPPPTIEWLHNNKPIATAKCPKPTGCGSRGNICKLTIETVNDRTQGQYVCRASNRLGQTSTALTLTK